MADVVRAYFEQFGEIKSYERPKEKKTNKLKGFCFIAFKKDGVIHEILKQQKITSHEVDGQKVGTKDTKKHNKEMSKRGRCGFMQGVFQRGSRGGYGKAQRGRGNHQKRNQQN